MNPNPMLTALLSVAALDPIGPVPDCGRCEFADQCNGTFPTPCDVCMAIRAAQVDPHGPVKRVDMVWELIGLD
jgi:hypothetical protein